MNTIKFLSLIMPLMARLVHAQTYSATYLPWTAPKTTEQGQTGTNQCGSGNSQTSMCQNAYINNVDDWCVWGPPTPGTIGDTERIEVAWCIKPGYGTRLIPDGTITGAHFVITPDFVQVTGVGDLTKINIIGNDGGGELDPHGADGNGNPIGGLVFSNAFGPLEQLHEWTNFVSDTEFCFRGCKPGPMAPTWCQHIYDVMGCEWNMPANYDPGVFEQCAGDSGEPMGVYGTSTFFQGQASTPAAHPVPASSDCTTLATIGNAVSFSVAPVTPTSSKTTSTTSVSASLTTTANSTSVTSTVTNSSSISTSSTLNTTVTPLLTLTPSATSDSTTSSATSSTATTSQNSAIKMTGAMTGASMLLAILGVVLL